MILNGEGDASLLELRSGRLQEANSLPFRRLAILASSSVLSSVQPSIPAICTTRTPSDRAASIKLSGVRGSSAWA